MSGKTGVPREEVADESHTLLSVRTQHLSRDAIGRVLTANGGENIH